ncbi:MAG: hypothetical protein ABL962_22285, partial [Fimbriimonadaceae bacterium]
MKPEKDKAIELLNQQLRQIPSMRSEVKKSDQFEKWREITCTIIANLFGHGSPQFESFSKISFTLRAWTNLTPESAWEHVFLTGLSSAEAKLGAFVAEITTFWPEQAVTQTTVAAPHEHLLQILDRFHLVVRQLRSRHAERATLSVADEYDVQDLLHALLKLHFDDVRPEEWTPSYAGGASRMDFILSEHNTAIEVKKTRPSMKSKELGDQLLIDIMRYKSHPNAKTLWCFVYDPEGLLPNPAGIERDLSRNYD